MPRKNDGPKKPRNISGIQPHQLQNLPPDIAFERRSRGGKNSSKKRREEKELRNAMMNLLQMQMSKKGDKLNTAMVADDLSFDQIQMGNATVLASVLIPVIMKAQMGDPSALNTILDIVGQSSVGGMTFSATVQDGQNGSGTDGINIHLIRGEKPKPEDVASNATAATQVDDEEDGEVEGDASE